MLKSTAHEGSAGGIIVLFPCILHNKENLKLETSLNVAQTISTSFGRFQAFKTTDACEMMEKVYFCSAEGWGVVQSAQILVG